MASPIGPQPTTTATWPLPTSPRRTACSATAIGSVSAATSSGRPLGTGMASAACTATCSAYAPGAWGDRPSAWTPSPARSRGIATTRVPGFGARAVRGPRPATSPTNSWPITTVSLLRMNPSYPAYVDASATSSQCTRACRSEPQMPARSTSSTSWPFAGSGAGTSATASRPS